jgi:CheY-like chemotaxis protein
MLLRGCELSGRIDCATVVEDGQAALDFLLRPTQKSDLRNRSLLAVVDMQSGAVIELLGFLRTTPSLTEIPVVALVSQDDDFMLVNTSEAEVHAVLSKPADPPNVADVVKALVTA